MRKKIKTYIFNKSAFVNRKLIISSQNIKRILKTWSLSTKNN